MYEAIITRIKTKPHPNASRLLIGSCLGNEVVVSNVVKDGQLGIYFPSDGELSHEMCYHNNLYRRGKGENKDPEANGYFEANRRIKCITIRGVRSEGIWLELDKLSWTGTNLAELKEGQTFTIINNQLVCNKYFSKATTSLIKKPNKVKTKLKEIIMLPKHYDTKQLSYYLSTIPDQADIIITQKLHGTSGRTGHVLVERKPWFWKLAINWLLAFFKIPFVLKTKSDWKHVTGSRNVTFDPREKLIETDFGDRAWRQAIGSKLSLHKGEVLYYELVGWMHNKPIMAQHSLIRDKDDIRKALARIYPPTITYSYGLSEGQYELYVYRITSCDTDGAITELSWDQIKARCKELGLKHVPELTRFKLDTKEALLELSHQLSDGPDPIDNRHPIEGVCIRVEHPNMFGTIFKHKGFVFKHLEGIAKEQDVIDIEEIS
jgi:hypothetical protein